MKSSKDQIYCEYDRQYAGDPKIYPGSVISSKIRDATTDEIKKAKEKFQKTKKCDHSYVIDDVGGWVYDFRSCAICGIGLGTV